MKSSPAKAFPALVSALLALHLPLVAQDAPGPSEEESVLRVYDLRAVTPRFDSSSDWTQSLVSNLVDAPHGNRERVDVIELYSEQGPEDVVDLLTQILGDELRYEGRDVTVDRESRLLVLAPERIQALVVASLEAFERALADHVVLSVDVLTVTGDPGGDELGGETSVDVAAAQRLAQTVLGRGASHESYEVRLAAGRTSVVDLMRLTPVVIDYDVEIAAGAFIYDPTVVEVETGTRLLVRGVPTPGGVMLAVLLKQSEMGSPPKKRPLKLRGLMGKEDTGVPHTFDGPEIVQSAEVLSRVLSFNTFLADGKALVATSECDLAGQRSRQYVILRRTGGTLASYHAATIPGSSKRILMVNTEITSPPELRYHHVGTNVDERSTHPSMYARLEGEPSMFLFDWMKYRFSVWRRLGPWGIVVTDPAWDGESHGALERLVDSWVPDTRVATVDVALRSQGGGAATPVRWSLPVRAGTGFGVLVGTTSTVLDDYDVEVAQHAAVPDTTYSARFHGLATSCRLASGQKGALTLDVRGVAQIPVGPTQTLSLQGPLLGDVQQVTTDHLEVDERVTLAPASPGASAGAVLGARGRQGEGRALRLEVTVR